MRRLSEKLSWVHIVNYPTENANEVENSLHYGKKTREFPKGMGARRSKISLTAQRQGIAGNRLLNGRGLSKMSLQTILLLSAGSKILIPIPGILGIFALIPSRWDSSN